MSFIVDKNYESDILIRNCYCALLLTRVVVG